MRITKETDYALRIVRCIASHDTLVDAKTISAEIAVPLRFTLKILQKLASGGVIASKKGSKGGYFIEKAPSEITMLQIFETIEGPIVIARCGQDERMCSSDGNKCSCFYSRVFDEINVLISEKLKSITLEDITSCSN